MVDNSQLLRIITWPVNWGFAVAWRSSYGDRI